MSREDIEVVTNVFIQDYQVVPEATIEIIDRINAGYCPICCGETSADLVIPLPGRFLYWECTECNVNILIEVWEV